MVVPYSLQSVFNGMHVIFVPYSLMKVDPASWMKMTTKYKGTNPFIIFIYKSLSVDNTVECEFRGHS